MNMYNIVILEEQFKMNIYNIEELIFLFFFFSVTGWLGETIMESGVRKHFVNKGFLKGPYVPVHGVGGFVIYAFCAPLKANPLLVFFVGSLVCTITEYMAAILLEKVFHIKGWDYDTYSFTRHCNYKKRIALTTSLLFGFFAYGLVYFYWDFAIYLMNQISAEYLHYLVLLLVISFSIDVILSGIKSIKNRSEDIPIKTIGLE